MTAAGPAAPGAGAEPSAHPFSRLGPTEVLDAVEAFGWRCDGRLIALNSYENRVYQVGVEDGAPVVAKFYRPGRWSDAAILEEHGFARELAGHEIPVVAPLADEAGRTLREHGGFRVAIFPWRRGRWPELDRSDRRRWLGRFLGRIHAVGAVRPFAHRPRLDPETFGEAPRRFVLERADLPPGVERRYAELTAELLVAVRAAFAAASGVAGIRVHGDCHGSNVLWSEAGPAFVDLDDCRTAPAVQDLWMFLSGTRDERRRQLADLLEGYELFHRLDRRELALVEALRTLRIVHYAAWLARRWDDPAFPLAFPWFGTPTYWESHLQALAEQREALTEPSLEI